MSKLKLANVRLSFPSLFQTAKFGGEDTGKFEATFILDKEEHSDTIAKIESAITKLMKEELKTKLSSDKLCLKDGDDMGRPEYDGKMTLKASTKKRPLVINRDKSPITEADNVVYAGCYVHAIVSLWAQNNTWGRRINAQLDGIQFFKDGEPFGEGGASVDDFDSFDSHDPFDDADEEIGFF